MRASIVMLALTATPVHADGTSNLGGAIGGLAFVGEVAIPDVRFEQSLATEERGWVLAWPVPLRVDTVQLGAARRLALTHTVEYQYATERAVHRGLAVERVSLLAPEGGARSRWSPIVEVGGVLGEDGAGAVVGLGVGQSTRLDGGGALVSFAGLVRLSWTNAEPRVDVSIDLLQLPLSSLGQ